MTLQRSFSLLLAGILLLVHQPVQASTAQDFDACLSHLRTKALDAGHAHDTLNQVLSSVTFNQRIVELDRSQAEFTETFLQYLDRRVSVDRVEKGRQLLREHRVLLQRIADEYGVRPEYIIAFWGMETNFGTYFGKTPVFDAVVTLACDGRRGEFFTNQFFSALRILEEGHIDMEQMKGSWAGAMGHTQFMPSTFLSYAVDYDGNGRKDLWNSLPDAFASAANYLSAMGWQDGRRWGREVILPRGFDYSQADIERSQPLSHWRKLGVRQVDGRLVPDLDFSATIVLPQGHRGPAFIVYDNFHLIMRWNRSLHYALAVGYMADRVAGMGQLHAKRPADSNEGRLSRGEVLELQQRLAALGLYDAEATGRIGAQTRNAVRQFQQMVKVPADAYPTHALLEQLRQRQQDVTVELSRVDP